MELEDISDDELDAALREPQPKAKKRKKIARTFRDWFYSTKHFLGSCENPECSDPRGIDKVMVATVNEKTMCRFCFLEGYGEDV